MAEVKVTKSSVLDLNVNKTLENEAASSVQNNSEDTVVEDVSQQIASNEIINEENPEKTNKTVMISATSKISACLSDVWYAFSFTESRQILDDSDMKKERQDLWDSVNVEVDNQVQDVIQMLKSQPQEQENTMQD